MKSKSGAGKSTLVRILSSPIRALSRARDFYINSFTECTTGGNPNRRRGSSQNPYSTGQQRFPSSLPRSLSTASSVSSYDGGEDLRELVRAASVRCYGHKNEAEMYVEQMRQLRQQEREAARVAAAAAKVAKVLPKSVSVGMGFMGRIDEDNTCEEFEEGVAGEVKDKAATAEKLSRSKSYAPASKRLPVF
ncbi:hypothetical protein LINPERPRIM_LOCUS18523 [Linum perenne]